MIQRGALAEALCGQSHVRAQKKRTVQLKKNQPLFSCISC